MLNNPSDPFSTSYAFANLLRSLLSSETNNKVCEDTEFSYLFPSDSSGIPPRIYQASDQSYYVLFVTSVPFAKAKNSFIGVSGGTFNSVLVHLDKSGNLLWSYHLADLMTNDFKSIGNIREYNGEITVGMFASTSIGTPKQALYSGYKNAGVYRFSPNGDLLWNTYFGNPSDDTDMTDLKIAKDGSIFLSLSSLSIPANIGSPVTSPASTSDIDGYIVKLSSTGDSQWYSILGGTGAQRNNELFLLDDGRIVVTGQSFEALDYVYNNPIIDHPGNSDRINYIAMFLPNGSYERHTFIPSATSDFFSSITSVTSSQIYMQMTATTNGVTPVISPYIGGRDILISKFDLSLNRIWATYIGTTQTEENAGGAQALSDHSLFAMNSFIADPGYASGFPGANTDSLFQFRSDGSIQTAKYWPLNSSIEQTMGSMVACDGGILRSAISVQQSPTLIQVRLDKKPSSFFPLPYP